MNAVCEPFHMVVDEVAVSPPPNDIEIIYQAKDIIVAIDDDALYVDTDGEGDAVNIVIKRNK